MKRRITNRLFRQVAAMRQLAAQLNRLYMTMTYIRGLRPQEAKRRRSASSM